MSDENSKDVSSSVEQPQKPNLLLIGAIVVAVVIGLGFLIHSFRNNDDMTEGSTISGYVNFNGVKPSGENADIVVKIMQKTSDTTDYSPTGVEIVAKDKSSWVWTNAKSGTTYTLKGDVYIGNTFIKSSQTVTSTAPASDQVLTFNVTYADVPDAILDKNPVTISGIVAINGTIPKGATVDIVQKGVSENVFQTAVEDITAADSVPFSWDEARAGSEYHLQAMLMYQGETIGEGDVLKVAAPATDEVLTVDSLYQPQEPAKKAAISGIVKLSGPVQQNSTIIILQRKLEETEYTVVDRMPAVNDAKFNWEDAVAGQIYEISAALQVKESNVATGNVLTLTAPAKNEVINIDTNLKLDPPTGKPIVTCGDADATNGYNAKVELPFVANAAAYWVEVGNKAGNNDVEKKALTADPGQNPNMTVYIKGGKKYFSHYAYTKCTDCDVYDLQNWSSFSPTNGFVCGKKSE